jgi:hypothetical protein
MDLGFRIGIKHVIVEQVQVAAVDGPTGDSLSTRWDHKEQLGLDGRSAGNSDLELGTAFGRL